VFCAGWSCGRRSGSVAARLSGSSLLGVHGSHVRWSGQLPTPVGVLARRVWQPRLAVGCSIFKVRRLLDLLAVQPGGFLGLRGSRSSPQQL